MTMILMTKMTAMSVLLNNEKYKEKVLAGFKIEKHSLDKMKKFHRDDAKRINPFNYIK